MSPVASPSPEPLTRHFARPAEAQDLVRDLLGLDPLYDVGSSGLFLAAPRRTGKTTFLLNDLKPELLRQGAFPLYVDLWRDRTSDPADVISDAIKDALREQASLLERASSLWGRLREFTFEAKVLEYEAKIGFKIDLVGRPEGVSLDRAFVALHRSVARPIVFMIDEAQHALMTDRGEACLFALKAAREALNITAQRPQLAILATGSLRGKLSMMVGRKGQAFCGATVRDLPPLGGKFALDYADRLIGHRLPAATRLAQSTLEAAFAAVHHRPEEFRVVLQRALLSASEINAAILQAAVHRRAEIIDEVRKQIQGLDDLPRCILQRMAALDDAFVPFNQPTLEHYSAVLGRSISASVVQNALNSLSAQNLVWKSARGQYLLDDHAVADFFVDGISLLAMEVPPEGAPATEGGGSYQLDVPRT